MFRHSQSRPESPSTKSLTDQSARGKLSIGFFLRRIYRETAGPAAKPPYFGACYVRPGLPDLEFC
jgi:hypothetical protein